MTGIVDVGGGMRGVFSAGIYDRFLEEGINFDLCIGVSAGSANLISYAAGHHDRVRRFYVDYARRKQYMSFDNFMRSGSYIGLDYIYSTLSNAGGEDPLNYDAFTANHTDFITVVTDGETGEPIYFPKNSIKRDDLTVIKASCCLPAVCKPIVIDGKDCFDGGISDSASSAAPQMSVRSREMPAVSVCSAVTAPDASYSSVTSPPQPKFPAADSMAVFSAAEARFSARARA